jgi:hypothetical protein
MHAPPKRIRIAHLLCVIQFEQCYGNLVLSVKNIVECAYARAHNNNVNHSMIMQHVAFFSLGEIKAHSRSEKRYVACDGLWMLVFYQMFSRSL